MMAEQRDQNDEWDGHAEEQKQNGPHSTSPLSRTAKSQPGASTALAHDSQNLHPLDQHAQNRRRAQPLHHDDVISLATPNGRGETRAKGANQ